MAGFLDALRRWFLPPADAMPGVRPAGDFLHLKVGRRYVVAKPFRDYDGVVRYPGEGGVFEGYDFLPYEDGLTLNLTPDAGIRLQWRPEAQGEIVDNLADYLVETPGG